MKWEDLSEPAKLLMAELGEFGPTVHVQNREVKGYLDGKVYWNSRDLRDMSRYFIEVADWLDRRAEQENSK